jgi:hypothetical protein
VKQLTHLVRWDVRRLQIVLGLWTLVVAANTLTGAVRPFVAADPSLAESAGVVSGLLWVMMPLLTMATVSFTIHGDSTVGTDAFWTTRPIEPLSLLAAKLLLLSVTLLALPAMTEAVLLLANDMSFSASAGVIAQSFSFRLIVMLLLALAAALTRNLPRFALLCGGAVLVVTTIVATLLAIQVGRMEDDIPVRTEASQESAGSLIVLTVAVAAAALITLAVQYVWRLRRRSVAVAAVGFAAAYVVSAAWPFEFLEMRRVVPAWAERPDALVISVEASTISTNRPAAVFPGRRTQWSTANGALQMSRPETGWMANVALRQATVDLPNGVTLRSPATWGSSHLLVGGSMRLEQYVVLRELLGVQVMANVAPAQPEEIRPENLPVLFLMRQPEFSKYAGARGSYRGVFDVSLTRFAIDGVVPIAPGAVHRTGDYRLVLDRTITLNGEPAIVARESRANSLWDRRPWSMYMYYLRNRERGQAIEVNDFAIHRGFALFRYLPFGNFSVGTGGPTTGLSTRGIMLSFPPRYDPRAETINIDEAWLAGAELVIVRQTQEGSVQRPLEIRDFPL